MLNTSEKHPMMRTVILQHNNAWPHAAHLTLKKITKNDWEILLHPPYSPDLALPEYHLFGILKKKITEEVSTTRMTVYEAVWTWIQGGRMDFYCSWISKLMQHSQKCTDSSGDFVKKWEDMSKPDWQYLFLLCTFISVHNKCTHDFLYELHSLETNIREDGTKEWNSILII